MYLKVIKPGIVVFFCFVFNNPESGLFMSCLPTPAHLLSQIDQHKEFPWCSSFALFSMMTERKDVGSSMCLDFANLVALHLISFNPGQSRSLPASQDANLSNRHSCQMTFNDSTSAVKSRHLHGHMWHIRPMIQPEHSSSFKLYSPFSKHCSPDILNYC